MKLLSLLLLCNVYFAFSQATRTIREDLHYGDRELVNYINQLGTTWTAGNNHRFRGVDHDVIKGMLGVRPPMRPRSQVPQSKVHLLDIEVPAEFDSRTSWPFCRSLREVRDQSSCGSCWAFGAVEAMSDRICIATKGKVQVHLSSDDLMSCCTSCGMGCDGGEPLAAWEYWVKNGLVTGSNFTSHAGCKPYPFPPCEHHSNGTHFQPCKHELFPTPKCEKSCQDSYGKEYLNDKHFGLKAYAVPDRVDAIQKEIMLNGPVEVAFEVYEDFLLYKTGVYKHHAGKIDGGHAVKMIGWGVEQDTPYWLVVNSWNSDWGDHGLFKILRGSNECGIEEGVVAGIPNVKKYGIHPRHHHRHPERVAGPAVLDMQPLDM
jgi:cathepsin B